MLFFCLSHVVQSWERYLCWLWSQHFNCQWPEIKHYLVCTLREINILLYFKWNGYICGGTLTWQQMWVFCTGNFSKIKLKSTKTITERWFFCENKAVCQKLARSCKKWKLAQKAKMPFLHETLQLCLKLVNISIFCNHCKNLLEKIYLQPFWMFTAFLVRLAQTIIKIYRNEIHVPWCVFFEETKLLLQVFYLHTW